MSKMTLNDNGTLVVSNRYDHLGRRVQKIALDGTHTFLYDGWRPVVETVAKSGGGTDRIEYYWGKDLSCTLDGAAGVGGLLYVKRNGAIHVPFYDAFGNVMGYWDEHGNVVAEYVYDAFGRTVAKNGTMADMFSIRYSTKYYDAEVGFYYYGKRYYLAELCRWLTRDPIEEQGGVNLYAFCGNGPGFDFDALGLTKYWDNYMNNTATPNPEDVWEKVGGGLLWSFLTNSSYWNTCALRVSRSVILSGHSPASGAGRNLNRDFVATDDASRQGEGRTISVRKGELLKAESPGKRYVIQARYVPALIEECLKGEVIQELSWSSIAEALEKAACIEKEDGEAFFADDSHVGMIKKGYRDKYFPQKVKGRIWRIK